jgi:hypothetical protein
MATFIGTLIIVGLCCLAMSLGLIFSGNPLSGGCGNKAPGAPSCEGCPKQRKRKEQCSDFGGESGC